MYKRQLQKRAEKLVGVPDPIRYKDRIVGVVMYRDNTIIDVCLLYTSRCV